MTPKRCPQNRDPREPWRLFLFLETSWAGNPLELGDKGQGTAEMYAQRTPRVRQDCRGIAEGRWIEMGENVPNESIGPAQEEQERIRRENAKKPASAAYSTGTHDAARDLWIAGWNDDRIAQTLGIPRRETVTEWARRENWLAIQRDFRKRILERTLEVTAQKVAEANAKQLTQIDGLRAKLFNELVKNSQVTGKSVEGLVRATIAVLAFERQVMGLDAESPREVVEPRSGFADEYEKMLDRVKDHPEKIKELDRLHEERLLLEARMRDLAMDEEPHGNADSTKP
jgi:Putative ATPase subunit of terminase (gpP-like)